jgi:hypothetical protein
MVDVLIPVSPKASVNTHVYVKKRTCVIAGLNVKHICAADAGYTIAAGFVHGSSTLPDRRQGISANYA